MFFFILSPHNLPSQPVQPVVSIAVCQKRNTSNTSRYGINPYDVIDSGQTSHFPFTDYYTIQVPDATPVHSPPEPQQPGGYSFFSLFHSFFSSLYSLHLLVLSLVSFSSFISYASSYAMNPHQYCQFGEAQLPGALLG